MLVTIFLSSPINAFIKDDLPAFGLPTTANLGSSSSTFSSSEISEISSEIASNKSPVPLPFIDEILFLW